MENFTCIKGISQGFSDLIFTDLLELYELTLELIRGKGVTRKPDITKYRYIEYPEFVRICNML
jgi:hypothetical protein